TALPMKRANWIGNGSSRPRSARNCWRCAGVASWPRMLVTGSPTYWNSMNAMKATTSITTRAWSRRRRMKASIRNRRSSPALHRAQRVSPATCSANAVPDAKGKTTGGETRGLGTMRVRQRKSRPEGRPDDTRRKPRSERVTQPDVEAGRGVARQVERRRAREYREGRIAFVADAGGRRVHRGALGQVVDVFNRVQGSAVAVKGHDPRGLLVAVGGPEFTLAQRHREAQFVDALAQRTPGVPVVEAENLGDAEIVGTADVPHLEVGVASHDLVGLGVTVAGVDIERAGGEADATAPVLLAVDA